jgi:hypothetical protein
MPENEQPRKRSTQLTDEDIISHLLREQGFTVSARRVREWITGKSPVPHAMREALEAIVGNFDHHLAVVQARLLFDPGVAEEALERLHRLDPVSRALASNSRHATKSGHRTLYFKPIQLPEPLYTSLEAMMTATGMKKTAFITTWLQQCIEAVIDRTETYSALARRHRQELKTRKIAKRERIRAKRYQSAIDVGEGNEG